jgi:hypothetical protein
LADTKRMQEEIKKMNEEVSVIIVLFLANSKAKLKR